MGGKWSYKRILLPVAQTIAQDERDRDKRYNRSGRVINEAVADSVENLFNELGGDGWELVTSINLDSGGPNCVHALNVCEYVFRRPAG